MRTISNRNDHYRLFHEPMGLSNTLRGQVLPLAEAIKKTTLLERQKMIEDSPLYDEFSVNPNADETMRPLDFIDLSVSPLDYTDAEELNREARRQILEYKQKFTDFMSKQKSAKLKEIKSREASNLSPDVAP